MVATILKRTHAKDPHCREWSSSDDPWPCTARQLACRALLVNTFWDREAPHHRQVAMLAEPRALEALPAQRPA